MMSKVIYPSHSDVQYLYSKYSTLENINILYKTLVNVLDSSFLSELDYKNIHDAYNQVILTYYPNEICIKSNFINKVLMKGQSHIAIFELPIGSSRADLCKINGKSIAYEIKTDLDNFSRLNKQLKDYAEIFDETFVICSRNNVQEIARIIPETCGIYEYIVSKRGTYRFNLVRKPRNAQGINSRKQLQLLRRREYYDYFNISGAVKQESVSDVIDYIIQKYNPDTINNTFKKILKERYRKRWEFLKYYHESIYEIDYQWFFKNQIIPEKIYNWGSGFPN